MGAKKRMIDPGIWTDPKIMKLSSVSVLIFIGMISNADDEGIIEAEPDSLYFRLARKDITIDMIKEALEDFGACGLVRLYGGYAFFPNWFKYQNLKGRKPQETKFRRPPKEYLTDEYRNEWLETFRRGSEAPYPFETCFPSGEAPVSNREMEDKEPSTTSESPVTHQCATGSAPVTTEVKGSEVKGSETSMPAAASAEPQPERDREVSPPEEPEPDSPEPVFKLECPEPKTRKGKPPTVGKEPADSLYHSIKDSFLAVVGDFSNWGKEGKAIHGIIEKSSRASPENPAGCAERMIGELWRLKNSGDRFYRDQPFVPSTLNASGIWDRVAEQLKITADELEGARMWEALDPYGVRGKAKQAVGG